MKLIIFLIILFLLTSTDVRIFMHTVFHRIDNTFEEVPYKKRNIAFITSENRNEEYIKYHDINVQKYCSKNGYTYIRLPNCDPKEASTYWCKLYKVRKYLSEYDYVAWLDSDTIFTDETPVDYYISKIGSPDIIIAKYLWEKTPLLSMISGHCAGVFFIKNSEPGRSFINDCITYIESKKECIKNGKEQGIWAGSCYEEGAMNLFLYERYSKNTYCDNNNLFILNLAQNSSKRALITHLGGFKNDIRSEVFKKYI
jgi:hypothetical protein